jgi:hypothetical protein
LVASWRPPIYQPRLSSFFSTLLGRHHAHPAARRNDAKAFHQKLGGLEERVQVAASDAQAMAQAFMDGTTMPQKQMVPVQWFLAMQVSKIIGHPRPELPGAQRYMDWQSGPFWQLAKSRRIRQSA